MPLEKAAYPWGNDGDVFPYSEELLQTLRGYERRNDISGYQLFFREKTEYAYGSSYESGA